MSFDTQTENSDDAPKIKRNRLKSDNKPAITASRSESNTVVEAEKEIEVLENESKAAADSIPIIKAKIGKLIKFKKNILQETTKDLVNESSETELARNENASQESAPVELQIDPIEKPQNPQKNTQKEAIRPNDKANQNNPK